MNNLEPTLISLDDFVLSGGGFNGESYDHKTDPSVMLKLYFPGKIQQPLDEMVLARKVYALGVPTPEPGKYIVTEDGRYGILFHRILNKKSYSRATADEPDRVGEFASDFADLCLGLHDVTVNPAEFRSVKQINLNLLEANRFFTPAEKKRVARFIEAAPDSTAAYHGDLQFSNAIFTPDHKRYFIDLGDFGYGYPMFDIGMVYLCCNLSSDDFVRETYHMPRSLAEVFWVEFARRYFGSDRPIADINAEVLPYAGLKTLIIERDAAAPQPEFRAALKGIL